MKSFRNFHALPFLNLFVVNFNSYITKNEYFFAMKAAARLIMLMIQSTQLLYFSSPYFNVLTSTCFNLEDVCQTSHNVNTLIVPQNA